MSKPRTQPCGYDGSRRSFIISLLENTVTVIPPESSEIPKGLFDKFIAEHMVALRTYT